MGCALITTMVSACSSQDAPARPVTPASSSLQSGPGVPPITEEAAEVTPASPIPRGKPGPTKSWKGVLEVKADTFYLSKGVIPTYTADSTKSSATGVLVLRVECDKGRLTSVVVVGGNEERETFDCDSRVQDRQLGKVQKGASITISADGSIGTNFAVELIVRSAPRPG